MNARMIESGTYGHPDPEQLLDAAKAGALLSVKPKTLYAWVSREQIPYRKIGSLVRFHRGELIEWAKAGRNGKVIPLLSDGCVRGAIDEH